MTIQPENIPVSLKDRAHWVVWRYEERDGKRTKVPYSSLTGERASTTDPETWTTFVHALDTATNNSTINGIGFVFTREDPFVGIDLDNCRDPETKKIEPWAVEIVRKLASYTEVTPSGKGLHVICQGDLPPGARRKGSIEMYTDGRYFTVTGERVGVWQEAVPAKEALFLLHRTIFAVDPAQSAEGTSPSVGPLSDTELIAKITGTAGYRSLWDGDISAYPSHSEADLALIGRIAFFAGPHPPSIDRLFRLSGLFREKWDDPGHGKAGSTYGQDTINRCLSTMRSFYQPSAAARPPATPRNSAVPPPDPESPEPPYDPFVASVALFCPDAPPEALEPEALHGIAGEVVSTIGPHTESSPAALLASFLIGAGVMFGRGPHVYRDGAKHGVNEFGCLVGVTAKGRKGTATRRVEEIFRLSINNSSNIYSSDCNSTFFTMHDAREDEEWNSLLMTGLGSGEGLIANLVEATKETPSEVPRRMVFEEEFSKCLKVMRRDGSTLSETLRTAWDNRALASRTKGKQLLCPAAHVGMLSHVTEMELNMEIGSTSIFNGFANRFLWFCTQKSKSLPFGGGRPNIAPLVYQFRAALMTARTRDAMEFDELAAEVWGDGGIYEVLSNRPKGMLGVVTSRAEAHVTRLALLYALLDGAHAIGIRHLMAALAVWDFSEKSCASIFGTSAGDEYADVIYEMLTEVFPGGLSRTEIRDRFQRHAPPGRIPKALAELEKVGKARKAALETGGRPMEVWVAVPGLAEKKKRDQSDKSPLQRARDLLNGAI